MRTRHYNPASYYALTKAQRAERIAGRIRGAMQAAALTLTGDALARRIADLDNRYDVALARREG